jgi:hypothetical protein
MNSNMNRQIADTVIGFFFICFGLWFSLFSKNLGHKTSNFYYRILHIRFSERGYKIAFLVSGIAFIIFGFLTVLRIISFK